MLPALSLSGRGGSAVVNNGLGHFSFIALYLPPKPSGRREATPWHKMLDALYKWTDVSSNTLHAGVNDGFTRPIGTTTRRRTT